jgi:ketosteroid isomerase-like protein
MSTTTTFDVESLAQALEGRDVEGQLAHYADDAELTIVDSEHPPARPIRARGRDEIRARLADIAGRDMTHRVTHAFANSEGGGYSVACRYSTGEGVACAALFELRDGKIVKLDGVQAWDS